MILLKIIAIVCWAIAGTCVLLSKNVTKFEYGILWSVYMFSLIVKFLEEVIV